MHIQNLILYDIILIFFCYDQFDTLYFNYKISAMSNNASDKKFKPEHKPFKENNFNSVYKVVDQKNKPYFAKLFHEKMLSQFNINDAADYNLTVLSDLSDQMYQEHFLQIQHAFRTPQGFIFVTNEYQTTLQSYLKSKVITQVQAMKIMQQVQKAIFSLYMSGFWHRNIRPEHFVKVGDRWKLQSLVMNQYLPNQKVFSQYLWNGSYIPPEAYGRSNFSEQQLDQLIVWNLGSLLVDLLLSHHKLKDENTLENYKGEQFSFRSIGVKKQFSEQITQLLSKMLHYDKDKRMKLDQLFSCQKISIEVARAHEKKQLRKSKIYVPGKSKLAISSQKAESIFIQQRFDHSSKVILKEHNQHKISEHKLKHLQETDTFNLKKSNNLKSSSQYSNHLVTISQKSLETSQVSAATRMLNEIMTNKKHQKAMQHYMCFLDKCQLLIRSIRIQKLAGIISEEIILLNKYAVHYVSLMNLSAISESLNNNHNFFNLDPFIWNQFKTSKQHDTLRVIVNAKKNQRKNILPTLRQKIFLMPSYDKKLCQFQQIQDFIHSNFKLTSFDHIKYAYRKILKNTYDIIVNQYNRTKIPELARTGMYITYCMTVDKLYIEEDLIDNFGVYFHYMNIQASHNIAYTQFQQYLDCAKVSVLIAHSIYILKKYFYENSYEQSFEC